MSSKTIIYNERTYVRSTGAYIHGNCIRVEFRNNGKVHKATVFFLQPFDDVQRKLDEAGELYLKILMLQRDGLFGDEAYRRLLPHSAFAKGKAKVHHSPTLDEVIKTYLPSQEPLVKCGERAVSTHHNESKTLTSATYLGPMADATDKILRTKGLGAVCMRDLSYGLLEAYRNVLLARGLAHKTINNVLTHLRCVGGYAVKSLKVIEANPFIELKLLKTKKHRRPVVFTVKEIAAIHGAGIEIGKEWLANMALLVSWAGLRLEEALGLSWQDVDMERGLLHVRRSFTYNSFGDLKNSGAHRTISLYPQALDILKAQQRWTAEALPQTITVIADGGAYDDCVTLVFQNLEPHGPIPRHFTVGGLRKQWGRLCRAAQVAKPLTKMRHTFASRMISAGASSGLVASIMGHRSTTMVDSIYGGFFDDYGRTHTDTVLTNLSNVQAFPVAPTIDERSSVAMA